MEAVIVKDASRFGRNYLLVGFYTEVLFPEKGVRYIAINSNVDSANPTDMDFTPFLNIMNEWYAKDTSNKIKAIFNARMSEGKRCSGSIPYGYNRLPDDKQKLVVDPIASEIVKRIFGMCCNGYSNVDIARKLREEKILIPAAYTEKYHPEQSNARKYADPYAWSSNTVRTILSRKEYLGHTILRKSISVNFKMHKRREAADDEMLVFENTHEPIVDMDTWFLAQKMQEQRRRSINSNTSPGHGQSHILTGLVFCADCGEKMYFNSQHNHTPSNFRCGKYSRDWVQRTCSCHYISASNLEEVILTSIKRIAKHAIKDEKTFAKELQEKQHNVIPEQLTKHLSDAQKRYSELSGLIKELFENFNSGRFSERIYIQLMNEYDDEQVSLEKEIQELKAAIASMKNEAADVEHFMRIIKRYKEPNELTVNMVNELIEKIVVHEPQGRIPNRTQKIDIYFNFIGQFDVDPSSEEIAQQEEAEKAIKEQRAEYRREYQRAYQIKKRDERRAQLEGHSFEKKVCPECGKEFWPKSNRAVYCSPECKHVRDARVLYEKRYAEKGNHVFRQRECEVCGKTFWPSNGQERLCSPECKHTRKLETTRKNFIQRKERKQENACSS